MAEAADRESKTEEPSEKKLRDAIEKGQVPISREVAVLASLAATSLYAVFLLRTQSLSLGGLLGRLLDLSGEIRLSSSGDAQVLVGALLLDMGRFLTPLFVLFIGLGLAAAFAQGLPRVVTSRIAPDLSRISPGKALGRLFGKQGVGELAKSVAKLAGAGSVAALLLGGQRDLILSAIDRLPGDLPNVLAFLVVRLVVAMAIIAALVAALDLVLTRLNWRRDLRMTRQELKDELKQAEGDPAVKGRFRSIARDRARRRMIAAVPNATLVVANPTHFAVALRYVRADGGAPQVIAKGQDLIALKIREIAEAHGIPVVEDKPLARALHEVATVDRAIPEAFYRAIAELIHFLGQRREALGWSGASRAAMEQALAAATASDKPAPAE